MLAVGLVSVLDICHFLNLVAYQTYRTPCFIKKSLPNGEFLEKATYKMVCLSKHFSQRYLFRCISLNLFTKIFKFLVWKLQILIKLNRLGKPKIEYRRFKGLN